MHGAADSAAPAAWRHAWVYLKLVAVALLWGGTFIAGRMLAQDVPPLLAASLRFAVAVPLLLLAAWKIEGGLPRLSRSQLLATAGLGFFGIFVYNICFFAALAQMPAGRTALFVALNPIVTTLLLAVFFRERVGALRWVAIAIAFTGAAIIITRGDLMGAWRDLSQSLGKGELYMLCGITGWAIYTILGRYALRGLTPIAATSYAVLWGAAMLGAGALLEQGTLAPAGIGWRAWAAIAYLGVFGTVIGFIWYYEGVKAIGPSRAAVFNNLVPVSGVLLAALVLGEPVLMSMVVGAVLVIGGVTMANLRRS